MLSRRTARWLLALADPGGAPGRPVRPGLRAADLARLAPVADWHGVLPAVVTNLKQLVARHGPCSIVAAARDASALEAALVQAARRLEQRVGLSMLLRTQESQILDALARRGTPAVAIKGADFADRVYPHPGLRTFVDVDLLVPVAAMDEAASALHELGYRQVSTPARRHAKAYGQTTWQKDSQIAGNVELHWDVVNSPALRPHVSVVFEDLQFESSPSRSEDCPRVSPSSQLLIASAHAATSHMFDRLQGLWDIALLARSRTRQFDEGWLRDAAKRTGAEYSISSALTITERVLGERACGELRRRLRLSPPGLWLRAILSRDVLLGLRAPCGSARKQLFREMLKRCGTGRHSAGAFPPAAGTAWSPGSIRPANAVR